MRHIFSIAIAGIALCALAGCIHEEAYPATQVTQVNQVAVVYNTSVHQGPNIDCEALCRNINRACDSGCRPSAYSPQMRTIQDSCERDCDFTQYCCIQDCRRGR